MHSRPHLLLAGVLGKHRLTTDNDDDGINYNMKIIIIIMGGETSENKMDTGDTYRESLG